MLVFVQSYSHQSQYLVIPRFAQADTLLLTIAWNDKPAKSIANTVAVKSPATARRPLR